MIERISAISTSNKKILSISIKIGLFVILGWLLYYQLFIEHNLYDLQSQFQQSIRIQGNWIFAAIAILLVPVNWLLESIKWRSLVTNFQRFRLRDAVFSVLSGISMAIITPSRIGEYGGRLVGIESANKPKALLANLISSLSQNIINIGVGLCMSLLFLRQYMEIDKVVFLSLLFVSLAIISILTIAYFRIDLIGGLLAYLPQHKIIRKVRSSISSFSKLDSIFLIKILAISFFRYSVYVSQYVLLIYFFGVTDQIWTATMGVCTIFFLQSNLPLPPILSVLARGEMAIFLWSIFTSNVIGIIAATFSLWLINLVIPAILGAMVISQTRLFKE